MEIIREKEYQETMDRIVRPYLEKRKKNGTLERVPLQPVYYEHFSADNPKAVLVLVHGFSESLEKFYETIWYFVTSGFHVWAIQQRGHGKSFRGVSDPNLVYLPDFRDLILDLHFFVHRIVKSSPETGTLPLYLFGHSMGGGVSSCYLERYPDDFSKAILSSPMLEINSGKIPAFISKTAVRLMLLTGRGQQYLPGASPFQDQPDPEGSCTTCETRYRNWFEIQRRHTEYQMCVPALATALTFLNLTKYALHPENMARVKAKVLLMQAGKDTMVNPGGQNAFLKGIGGLGKRIVFPEAKHEIYMEKDEILQKYWDEILSFLNS